MAIPQTDQTTPIFLTDQPDWGESVLIDRDHSTALFIAEDATEQRQQRRTTSKIGISYSLQALSAPEAFAREVSILLELQAPVVVPVWPYSVTVASQSGGTLTLSDVLTNYPFRIGGYVYIIDDNGAAFYVLSGVTAPNQISLSGTIPTFSNPIIWPCIKGTRRDGASSLKSKHTETSEAVAVDEL